jgi:hypothetical protein
MKSLGRLSLILCLVLGFEAALAQHSGSYTVPVSDPALKPFATFQTSHIRVSKNGNRLVVAYPLPAEIGGEAYPYEFKGTIDQQGKAVLSNENGVMKCGPSQGAFACNVAFSKFNFDSVKTEKFLRQISRSQFEFDQRMRVAGEFSGDPIGVLQIFGFSGRRR